MKNNSKRYVRLLGLVGACLIWGASHATQYTWDAATNTGTTSAAAQCGTVQCQMTWTLDATTRLTAIAYSTPTNYAPTGLAGPPAQPAGQPAYMTTEGSGFVGYYSCTGAQCGANGNWTPGRIFQYGSNGIGISNNVETTGQTQNDGHNTSTNATVAPQHAMDNNGAIDIAVFSLQKLISGQWVNQKFDPTSFDLGYVNNDSDVQAWAGGANLAANYDFKNVCFQGCNAAQVLTNNALNAPGFTEITNTISATNTPTTSGDGGNIPVNTTEFFTGTAGSPAQYLVVSGNLGLTSSLSGGNDFFKIGALTLTTGNGVAPIPGSVPLLALGLMVLAFTRRRALQLQPARPGTRI